MRFDMSVGRSSGLGNCVLSKGHLILAMDDTLLEMLAYQRADVIGRPEHDFTFLADRQSSRELFDKLKHDGRPFAVTKRYVRSDNTLIWVKIHVAASSHNSELTNITCSYRDDPTSDCDIVRKWQIMQSVLTSFAEGKSLFGVDIISFAPVEAVLALYKAELDGSFLSISELAAKAKLADPAMARWIVALAEREMVEIVQGTVLSDDATVRITQDCADKIDQIILRCR